MKLYHFTSILWLPEILKEGLTLGEVPTYRDPKRPETYEERLNAVNLTSNPSRADQLSIWAKAPIFDKTRVRLTLEIAEEQLTTFRQLRERHPDQFPSSWLKACCPYEERSRWFYVFGTVPLDAIQLVEVWDQNDYRPIDPNELEQFAKDIIDERDRTLEIVIHPVGLLKGARALKIKDGITSSWLFD